MVKDIFEGLPRDTFGVELEFLYPDGRDYDYYRDEDDEDYYDDESDSVVRAARRDVASALGVTTSSVGLYSGAENGTRWVVKEDCSCGIEVCTPALTWDRWEELQKVVNALSANYEVDARCGLHVHLQLDLAPEQLRRLLLYWTAVEPVLLSMVDASRNNNQYCGSWIRRRGTSHILRGTRPLARMQEYVYSMGRYMTLNLCNWWHTGRVEVRLHHGTLDIDEIISWVMFLQLLIKAMSQTTLLLKNIAAVSELPVEKLHAHVWDLIKSVCDNKAALAYMKDNIEIRFQAYTPDLLPTLEKSYA